MYIYMYIYICIYIYYLNTTTHPRGHQHNGLEHPNIMYIYHVYMYSGSQNISDCIESKSPKQSSW